MVTGVRPSPLRSKRNPALVGLAVDQQGRASSGGEPEAVGPRWQGAMPARVWRLPGGRTSLTCCGSVQGPVAVRGLVLADLAATAATRIVQGNNGLTRGPAHQVASPSGRPGSQKGAGFGAAGLDGFEAAALRGADL